MYNYYFCSKIDDEIYDHKLDISHLPKLIDKYDLKYINHIKEYWINNVQIISDKNYNSQKIKSLIANQIGKINFLKFKITIVIGGDGFMLQTLKKIKNKGKLFYGINSGNYGFLMNKFSSKNFLKNLKKTKMISISPLEMRVKTKSNSIKKFFAINEVSILRQSRQAATISIMHGSKHIIKRFIMKK